MYQVHTLYTPYLSWLVYCARYRLCFLRHLAAAASFVDDDDDDDDDDDLRVIIIRFKSP